ncbi:zinc finger protein CONSTANS-LIKE 15-like [Senna tora]|uniref:Zinc finger protein CONSTANS-LIKE 15-like n=1 Tax=Senna tora TaxID=362788 RepID=A0A834WHA4_9FABA|nr:zinc finger protein CONSTANS-LIKE 15-like [Senna tora]
MLLPCDFCDSNMAVLLCKADSAKLCLLCDQHVHSANALSLRHVRFKICDTCKFQTATVRCSTHNLMLCQQCDSHTHNNNNKNSSLSSSLHHRTPIQGFSGCPSILDLAPFLGFDFHPSYDSSVSSSLSEDQSLIYEQIVEMGRRNSGEDGVQVSGLDQLNNEMDDVLVQQMPLVSLLILPEDDDMGVRENGGETEELHLPSWDSNPTNGATQLGKSRDCAEQNILKFEDLQSLQDVCNFNRNVSTNGVDIQSRNEQSDESSSNHEMKKEESKKKGRVGMLCSSESTLIESIMKEDVEDRSESGSSSMIPKVRLEEIAKNRGDAMLRYREKKKTRRYDKQIRYESRKARADMRKRVKGRFVKASDTAETDAQI